MAGIVQFMFRYIKPNRFPQVMPYTKAVPSGILPSNMTDAFMPIWTFLGHCQAISANFRLNESVPSSPHLQGAEN